MNHHLQMDEAALRHRIQHFRHFLSTYQVNGEIIYSSKLKRLLSIEGDYARLVVDLNDLRSYNSSLCHQLQMNPSSFIPSLELALHEEIEKMDCKYFENSVNCKFSIGITGNAIYDLSPRYLQSIHIGKLVCLEGIITCCSNISQRLISSIHYCESTRKFSKVDYESPILMNDSFINPVPLEDSEGNSLDFEFGLSDFVDTQKIVLQDLPEKSPVGQLPRSIECILEYDLCDQIKAGDRVKIYGTYKVVSFPGISKKKQSVARVSLIVNNIIKTSGVLSPLNEISIKESVLINQLCKCPNIFHILSNSIAPSIYGHDIIKKALLLFLLGGVDKKFTETNTKIRGNINVLLIGDPSTAKSQFLRFVLNCAPLAISANARSSSGVGLTAAVVSDNNEKVLQAGAMVLADGGIVCIDELDKMTDVERVHMHEVMEQQSFSVYKAGIAVTLNARCSVLGACNPVYGKYDKSLPVHRNIMIPDTLLSRFDLVFILTDDNNSKLDRDIAKHVLGVHKFTNESTVLKEELNNTLFSHKNDLKDEISYSDTEEIIKKAENGEIESLHIPLNILKKYIQFAKSKYSPILTDKAREMISQKYVELRSNFMGIDSQRTHFPITPRTLEAFIRLSSAMAKLYMRNEVLEEDVQMVFKIFDGSLNYLNCGAKQSITNSEPVKRAKKETTVPANFDYVSYIKHHLIRKTQSGSIGLEVFKSFILNQQPKIVEQDVLTLVLNQFNEQGFCVICDDMNGVPTIYRFS